MMMVPIFPLQNSSRYYQKYFMESIFMTHHYLEEVRMGLIHQTLNLKLGYYVLARDYLVHSQNKWEQISALNIYCHYTRLHYLVKAMTLFATLLLHFFHRFQTRIHLILLLVLAHHY